MKNLYRAKRLLRIRIRLISNTKKFPLNGYMHCLVNDEISVFLNSTSRDQLLLQNPLFKHTLIISTSGYIYLSAGY